MQQRGLDARDPIRCKGNFPQLQRAPQFQAKNPRRQCWAAARWANARAQLPLRWKRRGRESRSNIVVSTTNRLIGSERIASNSRTVEGMLVRPGIAGAAARLGFALRGRRGRILLVGLLLFLSAAARDASGDGCVARYCCRRTTKAVNWVRAKTDGYRASRPQPFSVADCPDDCGREGPPLT